MYLHRASPFSARGEDEDGGGRICTRMQKRNHHHHLVLDILSICRAKPKEAGRQEGNPIRLFPTAQIDVVICSLWCHVRQGMDVHKQSTCPDPSQWREMHFAFAKDRKTATTVMTRQAGTWMHLRCHYPGLCMAPVRSVSAHTPLVRLVRRWRSSSGEEGRKECCIG